MANYCLKVERLCLLYLKSGPPPYLPPDTKVIVINATV